MATVYFQVIDHSQGSHIGGAEANFMAEYETAEEAAQYFCDLHNRHFPTNWEVYRILEVLL